jgi:hypothetical protein
MSNLYGISATGPCDTIFDRSGATGDVGVWRLCPQCGAYAPHRRCVVSYIYSISTIEGPRVRAWVRCSRCGHGVMEETAE